MERPETAAPDSTRLRLDLEAAPEAPGVARRALARLALGPLHDDTLLLASELVTNAVHRANAEGAGRPVVLEAEVCAEHVHVEVRDGGRRFQPGPEPDYGLRVVAGAADRWGIESGGETRAWFELGAAGEPPS
jgi:anti-sigma regulatory factor (Ser/Thr protein kinase)